MFLKGQAQEKQQLELWQEQFAKYFYQTEHYYHATLDAIQEATGWLDTYIQESDLPQK